MWGKDKFGERKIVRRALDKKDNEWQYERYFAQIERGNINQ